MANKKAPSGSTFKKFIIALVALVIIGLAGTIVFYYLRYFGPNVTDNEEYLYIHTGDKFDDVYKTIREKRMVKDSTYFLWAAQNMKYVNRVKPGRYRLKPGMSNRALINMLASGNQEPVNFAFHNIRLKEQFAAFAGKKLEPDSADIISLLDSTAYLQQYGFTPENVYVVFMPDTYQVYWNATPENLFTKMYKHYDAFWTKERLDKAAALGLNRIQVSILASLVDAEAVYDDEMPIIASLYLNRLKKGIHLEADPTLIFAANDFTIHRVLNKHKLINSPYNTYLYAGLPPGPVMMPSVNAIKAVLNPAKTDYLYMVAKEDFSFRHNFASNIKQHEVNARKYHDALDRRNIKK